MNATRSDLNDTSDNPTDVSKDFDTEDQSVTNDILQFANDLLSDDSAPQMRRCRPSLTLTEPQATQKSRRY